MFLLGNNYSPAGFSINEIRIAKLWDESKEYQMTEAVNRRITRASRFFVDDLKVYQECHNY